MRHTGLMSMVLQLSTGVWLRDMESGDQRHPLAKWLRKDIITVSVTTFWKTENAREFG